MSIFRSSEIKNIHGCRLSAPTAFWVCLYLWIWSVGGAGGHISSSTNIKCSNSKRFRVFEVSGCRVMQPTESLSRLWEGLWGSERLPVGLKWLSSKPRDGGTWKELLLRPFLFILLASDGKPYWRTLWIETFSDLKWFCYRSHDSF